MYGIRDGKFFIVDNGNIQFGKWSIVNIEAKPCIPFMTDSSYEVDKVLQEMSVIFGNYNLVVYKFTKDEEEDYLIRKLRGY